MSWKDPKSLSRALLQKYPNYLLTDKTAGRWKEGPLKALLGYFRRSALRGPSVGVRRIHGVRIEKVTSRRAPGIDAARRGETAREQPSLPKPCYNFCSVIAMVLR